MIWTTIALSTWIAQEHRTGPRQFVVETKVYAIDAGRRLPGLFEGEASDDFNFGIHGAKGRQLELLDRYVKENKGRIVSSPTLAVLDGQEAIVSTSSLGGLWDRFTMLVKVSSSPHGTHFNVLFSDGRPEETGSSSSPVRAPLKIVDSNWQTGSEGVLSEGDYEVNGHFHKARGWLIAAVKYSVRRP